MLYIIGIVAVSLFAVVAALVTSGTITATDTSVLFKIHSFSSPALTDFFHTITYLGDPRLLLPVGLALGIFLIGTNQQFKALFVVLLLAGCGLITSVAKDVFDRMRPELWTRNVHEESFSFPSGHASTSAVILLTLLFLFWRYRKARPWLIIIGSVYILTIGLSRLYLGVHYPSDIFGGWMIATAWFCLVGLLWRKTSKL